MKQLVAMLLPAVLVVLSTGFAFPTVGGERRNEPLIDSRDRTIHHWPNRDGAREDERQLEDAIVNSISRDRLRSLHDVLASRPHRAGTEGDQRVTNAMAALFEMLGLEVERQELWVYLNEPMSARLRIVEPITMSLPILEDKVDGDPYLNDPEIEFGFNGYSGSGDVTAEVVYANYGRKSDFARLKEWGVDCTGKIVIARYGGNFRGYKAKFAEEAGAAGLIIFTDPGDSGYAKGEMYPDGGWANSSYIQRGSLKTLDYEGDPLTPFVEATKDAPRLDVEDVALPTIPVQPVGWNAAQEILMRMEGEGIMDDSWKGGLPFAYRLTGGANLKVRLQVEQTRGLKKIENVIATLPGTVHPEQKVIVGSHHDAWSFGAGDPTSGTIVVFELARVFAEQAKKGNWPGRSIVFACWGGEEYGIIGSSEWVEANSDDLTKNAVAYINLDMASMGLAFGASAAPLLKDVILDAAKYVPQPVKGDGVESGVALSADRVFDVWLASANNRREEGDRLMEPGVGDLGGGSDHVGFYCNLGIPSTGMGGHGSAGTSYHSIYDNLHWYRQVVGNDYESAAMVAGVGGLTAWRMANAPLLPFDLKRYAVDARRHLDDLKKRATSAGMLGDDRNGNGSDDIDVSGAFSKVRAAVDDYEKVAERVEEQLTAALDSGSIIPDQLRKINTFSLTLERTWIREAGIPGRPWFRSLYAATDEDSGYASWMLPGLRYAVEHDDRALLVEVSEWYVDVFERLGEKVSEIGAIAGAG